jgi:hypothetical protein
MSIGSSAISQMARAVDSVAKDTNPDTEKEAQHTVVAVDQLLQELLIQALSIRETLRSLDEKEKKVSSDCNPKSLIARVFYRIVVSFERELENIKLKTNALNDECIHLFELTQKSIKKMELARLKTTLVVELSTKSAQASALESRIKSLEYRVKIARILSGPSTGNGALSKTNLLLLDLFLPPDRAEETSIALQDVCESKWEKRYGPKILALLCFVHSLSAIFAHHKGRIYKFGGLVLGVAELKKAFYKFWGA